MKLPWRKLNFNLQVAINRDYVSSIDEVMHLLLFSAPRSQLVQIPARPVQAASVRVNSYVYQFCWFIGLRILNSLWHLHFFFLAPLTERSTSHKNRNLMWTSNLDMCVLRHLTLCIISAFGSPYFFPFATGKHFSDANWAKHLSISTAEYHQESCYCSSIFFSVRHVNKV